MLLEILPAMPECLDDFLAWEPKDYREHFAASHFSNRDAVIAAYEAADPELSRSLDMLADLMNTLLLATRGAEVLEGHQTGAGEVVVAGRHHAQARS